MSLNSNHCNSFHKGSARKHKSGRTYFTALYKIEKNMQTLICEYKWHAGIDVNKFAPNGSLGDS